MASAPVPVLDDESDYGPDFDGDGESDYGPAFDSEDDAILSALLAKASTGHPARPIPSRDGDAGPGESERERRGNGSQQRGGEQGRSNGDQQRNDDQQTTSGRRRSQRLAARRMGSVAFEDGERGGLAEPGDGGGGWEARQPRGGRSDAPGALSPPPPGLPGDTTISAETDTPAPASASTTANPSASHPTLNPTANPSLPSHSDTRSPIARFRPYGRPLSVTDLVSPAWCELQWAFTLYRHGKKRPTKAMAAGSRVHARLEAEVHAVVPVDIATREDAFGLRIWNVMQGLHTLRTTGTTRELEVWGRFDGQWVNGVIDELGYVCPDTELEPGEGDASAEAAGASAKADAQAEASDASQTRMTDFLTQPASSPPTSQPPKLRPLRSMRRTTPRVYISDVKTRRSPTIPRGAAFRPTLLQLQLYRHLLGQMVSGAIEIPALGRALRLDVNAPLSGEFLAQLRELGMSVTEDAAGSDNAEIRRAEHGGTTLRTLFTALESSIRLTFPLGTESIGNVLKAEYRDPDEGEIRGLKTFVYDEGVIEAYMASVMEWWSGERGAQGVVVEEAYKCRTCEFAEDCGWRIERAEGKHGERERGKSSRV